MGKAWEPSKNQCSFGNQRAVDAKALSKPLDVIYRNN
jgi:hypothetical protein